MVLSKKIIEKVMKISLNKLLNIIFSLFSIPIAADFKKNLYLK